MYAQLDEAAALPANARYALVDDNFPETEQGVQFARQMKETHRGIKVVMTTWDKSAEKRLKLQEVCTTVVYKPITDQSIATAFQHTDNNRGW